MNRASKGFTLLEIIIVLFLITLIVGLSAVFFANFLPAVKFHAAGREMAALIRHARSAARMNMERQTLVIDLDNKTYGMEGGVIKNILQGSTIKIIDPFAGEVTSGKYSIVFHPAGSRGGGRIILSLGKKMLLIDIDPITGAVASREGH